MTGGWCRNAFSHQIQPQIWEVGFIKRVEGIGRTQDDFPGQLLNLLALVIAVIFLEGAACYRFITWKVFWPAATLRLCLQLLLSNKSEEGPEFPSWVLCWDTDPLHRLLQACAAAATTKPSWSCCVWTALQAEEDCGHRAHRVHSVVIDEQLPHGARACFCEAWDGEAFSGSKAWKWVRAVRDQTLCSCLTFSSWLVLLNFSCSNLPPEETLQDNEVYFVHFCILVFKYSLCPVLFAKKMG